MPISPSAAQRAAELAVELIRNVPDFPTPGVNFRDISVLLADAGAFRAVVDTLVAPFIGLVDKVAAIEARGFVLGAPAAYALEAGLVVLRKPGKLPLAGARETYALEYGSDALELPADAITPGERVLLVDDIIATGGTASAAVRLVRRAGGEIVGLASLLELDELDGRARLEGIEIHVVVPGG